VSLLHLERQIYTVHSRLPFIIPLPGHLITDEEDLFMVCDLLAGGDLRYHLTQKVSSAQANGY
jgi:hypothetical protein